MKVLTPGHKYELKSFEGGVAQVLQFIEKVPVAEGSTELRTVNDGTTNEEVLKMLLDRLNHQHAKLPSEETAFAIGKLESALMWLNIRTDNRTARGVEGTMVT